MKSALGQPDFNKLSGFDKLPLAPKAHVAPVDLDVAHMADLLDGGERLAGHTLWDARYYAKKGVYSMPF
jgi:hypothetical protein